jgi:hypothetical protein
MVAETVVNIGIVVIVVVLVVSFRLAKRPKHLVLGGILIAYSGVNLLSHYELIEYSIPNLPVITYMLSLVVTVGGANLVLDSLKQSSFLRVASLVIGVLIVFLSVAPSLYEINAITFELPSYPKFVNYYLYSLAGFFLFVAAFVTDEGRVVKTGKLKLK